MFALPYQMSCKKYFEWHLSDAQMKTPSLDSGRKLKHFSLFAASGSGGEVERTVTRLRTKESRGRSEAVRGWKEKRRTEQRRDLSGDGFKCSVLVDQVAESVRPQNLLRPRGERWQGEIEKLVSETFVHVFEEIFSHLFPLD